MLVGSGICSRQSLGTPTRALTTEMVNSTEKRIALYREFLASPPLDADAIRIGCAGRELSQLLAGLGKNDQALEEAKNAMRRLRETVGLPHPLMSMLQLDCADRLYDLGRFVESFEEYGRAIELIATTHGAHSVAHWSARERAAVAARSLGKLDCAHGELNAVLEYRRSQADRDPASRRNLTSTLIELATLYRIAGRKDRTSQLLKEAGGLAIELTDVELLESVNEQHGALAFHWHEYAHSLSFRRLVYQSRLNRFGPDHPKTLHSLSCLGESLARSGHLAEAREALEQIQSRECTSPVVRAISDAILAEVLIRLKQPQAAAQYDIAVAQFEAMNHRARAIYRRDSVFAELENGNIGKAVQSAHASVNYASKLWRSVLQYGSEADRIAWQSITEVFSACAAVAEHDPMPLIRAVRSFKGVVTDSLVRDRSRTAGLEGSKELEAARSELRRIELQGSADADQLARARRVVEQLESNQTIRLRQVELPVPDNSDGGSLSCLRPNEFLVEYVRFQKALGGSQFSPWYGALIGKREGSWLWVDLGPADGPDGIDAAIRQLDELVRARLLAADSEFLMAAESVWRKVWSPIHARVAAAPSRVVFAPDGLLNLVSPAILWDGSQFLGESIWFRHVTSARYLSSAGPIPEALSPPVVVSGPEYSDHGIISKVTAAASRVAGLAMEFLRLRGEDTIPERYEPLDGALEEGRQIHEALKQAGHGEAILLSGAAARKESVRSLVRPTILHLATHAQFLPEELSQRNPMLRSWLALAGANHSLELLRNGIVPEPGADGLLYADEIASMDLHGTQLVVLSACDTGRGTIQSGEGVYGLRRAFQIAGASTVVLTLWRVEDGRTTGFMAEFYAKMLSGLSPADALAEVQGSMLKRTRSSDGPAAAARRYGAFVISA